MIVARTSKFKTRFQRRTITQRTAVYILLVTFQSCLWRPSPGSRHFGAMGGVLGGVLQPVLGRHAKWEPEGEVNKVAGARVAHVPRGAFFFFKHGEEAYLIDLKVVDLTAKTNRWDRSSSRLGSDWCEESALKNAHAMKLSNYGKPLCLTEFGVGLIG